MLRGSILILVGFLSLAGLVTACSGGGGGSGAVAPPAPPPSEVADDIVYEKYRDPLTGDVTPVFSESGGGFDGAEVDSPSVAIDSGRPAGDLFMLFYEATDAAGITTIGLVTSDEEDFENLTVDRVTPVIGLGGGGSGYDFAATDPMVIVDKRPAENPDRRYKIWFEGRSGIDGGTSTIIYAHSADGETWTGFAPCTGLNANYASVRVADPTVIREGATYRMWFEAIDSSVMGEDGPGVIGYATSPDGINWLLEDANGTTGVGANPVFLTGPAGTFDAYSVNAPSVVFDPVDGLYKLWYEAGDNGTDTENTIGFATSPDGLNWSNPTLPILIPSSDLVLPLPFDSGDLEHPSAAVDESLGLGTPGHYLLWYTGDNEGSTQPNRIGLATGRAGP